MKPGVGDVARIMSRDYFCVGMVLAISDDGMATVEIHDTPFPHEEETEVLLPLGDLLLY